MPLYTFDYPNGPEFVPCLGNKVVNPGDVVDIPEEYVDGLPPDKWTPADSKPAPAPDSGGNADGA